jgi:multidrug efflux pump subunit AcrA (membrane-fusion protein)
MTTSSTRRVVTVDLDPSDGELVKRGTSARVELPDGKDVKGRVSSIGTVAQDDSSDSGTGGSSNPTIEVTISLPEGSRVTGLDQAPVTVDLTDQVRHDVFVVPVESLLGTAGGGYAIEVRDSAGRRQIPVEPGLFADGYVEVEGEGLREGMEVEVPGE